MFESRDAIFSNGSDPLNSFFSFIDTPHSTIVFNYKCFLCQLLSTEEAKVINF